MKIIGNPKIKKLALHHTAVSRERQSTQLDAVNRYHKNKDWGGGWKQTAPSSLGWYVGYNFFCDVNGVITQTRTIGEETIAQYGHNCTGANDCDTVSFCFAGNFNSELPNDKQIKAFKKWYADFPFTVTVVGHRDLQASRTCPGELMTKDYIDTRLLGASSYPDTEDKAKAVGIEESAKTLPKKERPKTVLTKREQLMSLLKQIIALLISRSYPQEPIEKS